MKQYRFKINYQGRFSYSWGYAMYSSLLEKLQEDIGDYIHENPIFNQYIVPEEWVINTEQDFPFKDKYFLHKYNTTVELGDRDIIQETEQEMADRFLIKSSYKKVVRINFLTPTTFKQDGDYVLYPTRDLIMQSLTNKWNNWAQDFVLEDIYWNNCKISRYNLRTVPYMFKGVRIQGFIGYVDLYFWGSESLIRLANMVCNYGNFSGIGIKTSLGMGGIRVE